MIFNPRRACAARVTVSVNLTSRVFVSLTKDTTYLRGNEGQNFERFSLKTLRCKARAANAIFIAAENAHALIIILNIDQVRLLCLFFALFRYKKSQRRACIDSRMLSTTVASPCQTLRELYTSGRPRHTTKC